MNKQECLETRDRYLMAQIRHQLYDEPLVLSHGKMDKLYDTDGKEYIDCFSGIMVVSLGHCNPEINEAIHRQLDTLCHVSTFFLTPQMLELAEELARITPEGLVRSYFVNSGSEAVDGAILLARAYTGKDGVVPVTHAYHGRTLLGTVCTNVAPHGQTDPRAEEQHVVFGQNGYCYRCPYGEQTPGCSLECTRAVRRSVESCGPGGFAAILLEPIQGVGGVITPPADYLKEVQQIAWDHGGLLILDEVQSGFGRTGSMFYTSQIDGLNPDILCMAKAMGNGLAAGAYIARDEVGEALKAPTFATFGGSPLASAASLAVIHYMEEHRTPERAQRAGRRFRAGLREMQKDIEQIGDLRGEGLFLGVELVRDRHSREPASEETLAILTECKRNGLIVGKSGQKTNVIRIGPPLIISDDSIDRALDILDLSIRKVFAGTSGGGPLG